MVHLDLHEVSPTPANIIERAERVKRAMPLKYLIIDPYLFMEMETGRYNTETQAIKGMLTQMQAWGRNNGVWVIIVAHPRSLKKLNGKNELEEIDMYTISGSANWANLVRFHLFHKPHRGTGQALYPARYAESARPGTVPHRNRVLHPPALRTL